MTTQKEDVCIARQPILNQKGEIKAYELLFRATSNDSSADIFDSVLATSRVLINTLNNIGTKKILGNKLGFINIDDNFLKKRSFEALDGDTFVLEILETTMITPELQDILKEAKEKGFKLTIDDFCFKDGHVEQFKDILPIIDIIKVDIIMNTKEEILAGLKNLIGFHGKLLAEKVETEQEFKDCCEIGFDYFQGYYFAKPVIVQGKKLDPNELAVISIVKLLQSNPETDVVDSEFKKYPDLTINLLRFMNSAAISRGNGIKSVRQAITLIGQKKLLQWLLLMLYGSLGSSSSPNPLFVTASQRAKTIENILKDALGYDDSQFIEKGFLTGILSQMDSLLGVPMEDILSEFQLDADINQAVLHKEGLLGQLLELCIQNEQYNIPKMKTICNDVNINFNQLTDASIKSYQWTEASIA